MLEPIRLTPAFRHGADTPWGGKKLKTLFHKPIPDDRTGESLEMSVIPSLESRDDTGRTLSELILAYGETIVGTAVHEPFPLLLKIIDAREQLSVQVHPNDEYAGRAENKLGKTEAWVILEAEEGAELVFGLREGVTREDLRHACAMGKPVEALLNRVPVHSGDVFYIPSGTLHAIGSGIVLYEIQQSSDVTYRFYDWNRVDAQGNARTLHIDQALDVVNLHAPTLPQRPQPYDTGKEILLDQPNFFVERWTDCESVLEPDIRRFSVLTALQDTILQYNGKTLTLHAGETVFQPADGYRLFIRTGGMLISKPGLNL